MKILVINPGSTSTKVAYYQAGYLKESAAISHTEKELRNFSCVLDQLDFRRLVIFQFMIKHGIEPRKLDAVVARGGILPPVKAGAYQINSAMIHYLTELTPIEHPANLGALLARQIQFEANAETLAMIYDPVSVDEFLPIAQISGLKGVQRKSLGYALNMRAVAMKVASDLNQSYRECAIIVAHLGSGNSISLHHQGKMIDVISDDEGPFAMERTGSLPLKAVFHLGQTRDERALLRLYKRSGRFRSYTGTTDLKEIEAKIATGNHTWALVHDAFCYQVAKGIGELATVVNGAVDRIVLTGGVAYSATVVAKVRQRVEFIAPVVVEAGEHELAALANGAQRVLAGKENLQKFQIVDRKEVKTMRSTQLSARLY